MSLCGNCRKVRYCPDSGLLACECQGVLEDAFDELTEVVDELVAVEDGSGGPAKGSRRYEWLFAKGWRLAREAREALEG